MKDLNFYLEKYEAKLLPTEQYDNSYIGWALKHFMDETAILNPYLDITLKLDITDARTNYVDNFQNEFSTFTSFLIWKLLKTIKRHPCFAWKFIGDRWYLIDNPPLFLPIAVGGKERFGEIIIDNATKLEWLQFSQTYQINKNNIFKNPTLANDRFYAYHLGQFIGNLPNLDFSSFVIHSSRKTSQCFFYFGKRTHDIELGRLTVPLAIKFHHSNTDPFVIDLLIKDYLTELNLPK